MVAFMLVITQTNEFRIKIDFVSNQFSNAGSSKPTNKKQHTIEFAVPDWSDETTNNCDKHLKMLWNAFKCTFINGMIIILALAFAISMAIDDRKIISILIININCWIVVVLLLRRAHWNERRARISSSCSAYDRFDWCKLYRTCITNKISTAAKMKWELKIKCCFFCCRRHQKKKRRQNFVSFLSLFKHRKQWNLAI